MQKSILDILHILYERRNYKTFRKIIGNNIYKTSELQNISKTPKAQIIEENIDKFNSLKLSLFVYYESP